MNTQLIPQRQFKQHLRDLCMSQINEAIKGINALNNARKERQLKPCEKKSYRLWKAQLETNELWMKSIDPEYGRMQ